MYLVQNFLPSTHAPSKIQCRDYSQRQAEQVAKDLSDHATMVGISVHQSVDGSVTSLALATEDAVHHIALDSNRTDRLILQDGCLHKLLSGCNGLATLVGFRMAPLAMHLRRAINCHVRGVDLSTVFSTSASPQSPSRIVADKWYCSVNTFEVDRQLKSSEDKKQARLSNCLRAWISVRIAMLYVTTIEGALPVDTQNLQPMEFDVVARAMLQFHLLYRAKPAEVESEFGGVNIVNKNPQIHNTRYSNRVRRGNQVLIRNTDGTEFIGYATGVQGKTARIKLYDGTLSGTVRSVVNLGRGSPTMAEKVMEEFFLHLLRGERRLQDSRFVRALWFPSPVKSLPDCLSPPLVTQQTHNLNNSQQRVVSAMLSEARLVITHGPPGTGKTTTIAAAVQILADGRQPVWIVAQSNVAVKNIAESLARRGVDFKLLVSKEFYVEWHEHLYTAIQTALVRSDEVPETLVELGRVLGSSIVVLCTLSMLSNPVVVENIEELIPLRRLIIDEASQIDVFQYMPVFGQYKLEKVCFFGDPQQLPPYGPNTATMLESIFDMRHLRNNDYFLDTQYRMPTPLGEFISNEVYGSRLRSVHAITTPSCLSFVDVAVGGEQRNGTSWVNPREVGTIVNLVRLYYRHRDFCVITPYDAQRALIERSLKDEGLPWERVHNVDSFQGNEADYVLISVVRTAAPGFLVSRPRLNVLLTRCRAGMVIAARRAFLHGAGAGTLLGRLCACWEARVGAHAAWADWRAVAEGHACLPGAAPVPRAPRGAVFSVHAARDAEAARPPLSAFDFPALPAPAAATQGPVRWPAVVQGLNRPAVLGEKTPPTAPRAWHSMRGRARMANRPAARAHHSAVDAAEARGHRMLPAAAAAWIAQGRRDEAFPALPRVDVVPQRASGGSVWTQRTGAEVLKAAVAHRPTGLQGGGRRGEKKFRRLDLF